MHRSESNSPVRWALVFASAVSGALALVWYYVIFQGTHHRPLGAATLAVLVLSTFITLLAFSFRIRVGAKAALCSLGLVAVGLLVVALVNL